MLTKLKHNKGTTEILWKDENSQTGESVEHKLTCGEPPRPELKEALNAFAGYVIDVCELPRSYVEGLTVIGVSLAWSDSLGIGIVVTSLKSVSGANSPVVINTPYLSETASCEGAPRLPAYVTPLLAKIEGEAQLYRSGSRAQMELPIGGAK